MIWLFCVILVLYVLYKYFSKNVNFWKDRGVDGPKPLPLFGNLLDNFKAPINDVEIQRWKKYGKIYGYLDLMRPVLTVADVDLIKLITIKDFYNFTNHVNMAPGDPFLEKVLPNLRDDEWKRVRNICTPAFTISKIKAMFPLINQVVENSIEYFTEMDASNKQIELHSTFSKFSADVTAGTVFGVEVNSFKDFDSEYSRKAETLFTVNSPGVIIGSLLPNAIRKFTNFYVYNPESCDYFKKLVKHVIKERKGKEVKKVNLLTMLMHAELNDAKTLSTMTDEGLSASDFDVKHSKKTLDENEILATCVQMIVAGVETIVSTLTFFTFEMALKPNLQLKLYDEVKKYFENEKYTFDSLMSLPYLDAVIKETLRHHSPAIHFDRVASNDYELGDTGIIIPKNTVVNIPFYVIQHDPEYWPEPFEFKPERFLPENLHRIVPYSFAPFGYGPRICIGYNLAMAELKAFIANVIYRFEVVKTEKTPKVPKYTGKKIGNHCESISVLLKKRFTQ